MAKSKKVVQPLGMPEAMQHDLMILDARNAYYLAGDPRRRIDNKNGNQVNNDLSAFANCPPDGFQRYFPRRDLTGVEE